MENTHIMVSGANGFVGRNVVAALNAKGARVTTLMRPKWDMAEGGKGLLARVGKPDAFVHLAWGGLPCYTAERHVTEELPLQYRFLRDLVEDGLTQLIVTGTCLEYGMQSGCLSEELLCAPATNYGKAKHRLHEQLLALKTAYPFALTWARLFYVYGEGQAPTSLYPQLMAALARGDTTFNMSGGEQIRDYLPIEDAAQKLATLALSGMEAGTVNVCSGIPVKVRQLVQELLNKQGKSITLNFGHYPYPDYEPMEFWGDTEKFNALDS